MRVRIGICLFALSWPLLATAAPVLASSAPTHACCRREGAHHCDSPAWHQDSTNVTVVCPQSGKRLKFAGSRSARPATLVALAEFVEAHPIATTVSSKALPVRFSQSSPRAPPFA